MSGDSNLIEEEAVEMENLIDLLGAHEAEESDDEIDDEDETDVENDDMPDDPDLLKVLLRKQKTRSNKLLNKARKARNRTEKERDEAINEKSEISKRLDAFEQKLNGVDKPNDDAVKAEREEEEWAQRVADDPAQAIEYAKHNSAKLEDRLANFLGSFEERIASQFAKLNSDTDPERQEYRAEIQKLRNNPDFEDFDDATILKLAKTLKQTKVRRAPASISGGRALKTLDVKKDNTLSEEAAAKMGW